MYETIRNGQVTISRSGEIRKKAKGTKWVECSLGHIKENIEAYMPGQVDFLLKQMEKGRTVKIGWGYARKVLKAS